MTWLAEWGARLLGGTLVRSRSLSGGDLSEIVVITLTDGRTAVVKSGPAPRIEAGMLSALAAAGAPAPQVLAVGDDVLALEYLPDRQNGNEADLGQVLKCLHAVCEARYGWAYDYAFGTVVIENAWTDDWCVFWGARRLLSCAPHVPVDLARRLERLAAHLDDFIPRRPRASLLHGDLWGGNVLWDGAQVCGLIDPASYYGDGEVDLAMLNLFGRTGPAFQAAYGPLPTGWQARRAVYQLWPALVHLRLFGAGYRGLVEGLLSALKA